MSRVAIGTARGPSGAYLLRQLGHSMASMTSVLRACCYSLHSGIWRGVLDEGGDAGSGESVLLFECMSLLIAVFQDSQPRQEGWRALRVALAQHKQEGDPPFSLLTQMCIQSRATHNTVEHDNRIRWEVIANGLSTLRPAVTVRKFEAGMSGVVSELTGVHVALLPPGDKVQRRRASTIGQPRTLW